MLGAAWTFPFQEDSPTVTRASCVGNLEQVEKLPPHAGGRSASLADPRHCEQDSVLVSAAWLHTLWSAYLLGIQLLVFP